MRDWFFDITLNEDFAAQAAVANSLPAPGGDQSVVRGAMSRASNTSIARSTSTSPNDSSWLVALPHL